MTDSRWPTSTVRALTGLSWVFRIDQCTGDGKADFLTIDISDGSAWAFLQEGSRTNITTMYGAGAGVRLADLNGYRKNQVDLMVTKSLLTFHRRDGLDDYIMVRPDTSAIGFWNGGPDSDGNIRWPSVSMMSVVAVQFTKGCSDELRRSYRPRRSG